MRKRGTRGESVRKRKLRQSVGVRGGHGVGRCEKWGGHEAIYMRTRGKSGQSVLERRGHGGSL